MIDGNKEIENALRADGFDAAADKFAALATQPEAALREALERIDIQALEREAGEALDAWDQEHGLSYVACFSIVSGIILAALKDHRHG
jgi:hypothetical protein